MISEKLKKLLLDNNLLNPENEELIKEAEQLEIESYFLYCLNAAGVDNWEGYNFAIDEFYEKYDEEEITLPK